MPTNKKKLAFDNKKYLKIQRQEILKRIKSFGGKLYLEFGGKLFDDFHASRVLPGFEPDSKLQMLLTLKDDAEIVMAVNADDIKNNKVRNDLGITYQSEVERLIDAYQEAGLYVSSVVFCFFEDNPNLRVFAQKLRKNGIKVYKHYRIAGYPQNLVSVFGSDGFQRNDYVETTRPLVVVTAPGPGSGKMAVCLSQLYHDMEKGIKSGYAKYETFPVWNLPLSHPVNLAYEAATVDLADVNMIDPYHLAAYVREISGAYVPASPWSDPPICGALPLYRRRLGCCRGDPAARRLRLAHRRCPLPLCLRRRRRPCSRWRGRVIAGTKRRSGTPPSWRRRG